MAERLLVQSLEVRYGPVRAVAGASVSVAPGEVVALLGPSGCGKTTLLRTVAGFERAHAGEVFLDGELIESPRVSLPARRRAVGLVFQDYALFPHRTVAGNIAYGLGRGPRAQERVRGLLALAALQGLEERYPHQLSGGQQQRVAVLRSLAPRPRLLLLDEPFSNLDPALRADLRGQLAELLRAEGVSAVLVTHDRADAMAIADRIAIMEAGAILQVATPRELYFAPRSEAVARYTGEVQFVPGRWQGDRFATPLGLLPALGTPGEGEARALLRPEWLVPCPGAGLAACVVAARLEGHIARYTLRLAAGPELAMVTASGILLEVGQHIAVAVGVPVPVVE